MAKVTGPLLSFGARGSIGKAAVFASWRGVAYARQHVVPANPQSTNQTTIRTTFALLREMWKRAPSGLIAPWNAFASGRPFTGMNKFVGENVRVLKYEVDMNNFIASPGSGGGIPPDMVVFNNTGGSGKANAVVTAPAPPTGWILTGAQGIAFQDQSPDGIFEGVITYAEDLSAPYTVAFTGLLATTDYQVAAWLKWEKPDGSFAYSASVIGQVTTT